MRAPALLVLALGPYAALSLGVLVLHPFYAGSHVLTLNVVARELLSRGHTVTTVKFHEDKLPPLAHHPNHTVIDLYLNNTAGLLPNVEQTELGQYRLPMDGLWHHGNSFLWTLRQVFEQVSVMRGACEAQLSPVILSHLAKETGDVALVVLMFNECGLAMAARLGVPAVGFGFSMTWGPQEFSTLDTLPSYVPVLLSHLSDRMTFLQRTYNLLVKASSRLYMYYYTATVDAYIRRYLGPGPRATDLQGGLSGVLVNTDWALDYPRSYPPSFHNIGGLQIRPDPGPLPPAMRDFIEGAGQHGVILFTMGFIFDPSAVPQEFVATLLSAFSRLPQRVIVKFDSPEVSAAAPSNVLVVPWVPQQAVLAHPATRLFITHCGVHGVLEAIYHAVPMVGIPVFVDQGDVLTRMVDHGVGVGLDKKASAEEVVAAVEEVRDGAGYRAQVTELSRLLRLRRHSPLEDAVWLLEYVAGTGGAEHLKLASRHLDLAQYYSLDSILLLCALLAGAAWLMSRLTRGRPARVKLD
jgi:glucuronosyltransferase